jgi:hypothetical protein
MLLASLIPSIYRNIADQPLAGRKVRLKIQRTALRKIEGKLTHVVRNHRAYHFSSSKYVDPSSSHEFAIRELKYLAENSLVAAGNPEVNVCVASTQPDLPGLG